MTNDVDANIIKHILFCTCEGISLEYVTLCLQTANLNSKRAKTQPNFSLIM